MNTYELKENGTGKVVGKIKIKKTIREYATGAIDVITDQLKGVKSPRRKLRLETRLGEWKRVLELVEQQQVDNLKALENSNEQKIEATAAGATETNERSESTDSEATSS